MAVDPFVQVSAAADAIPQQVNPNANVTVGVVPIDDTNSLYSVPSIATPSESKEIFTDYEVVNRYENPQHRYMLGITSPSGFNGQSAAFVQLASPTLLWVSDWTALKWNGMPTIPDPTSQDDTWVLLAKYYQPAMLVINPADGQTPGYRISGTYVYGKKNPSTDVIDDISFARPPWIDNVPPRRPDSDEMYDDTLIDALE